MVFPRIRSPSDGYMEGFFRGYLERFLSRGRTVKTVRLVGVAAQPKDGCVSRIRGTMR